MTTSNPSHSFSRKGGFLGDTKKKVVRQLQSLLFMLSTHHTDSAIISAVERQVNEDLFVLGPIKPSTVELFMVGVAPRIWR